VSGRCERRGNSPLTPMLRSSLTTPQTKHHSDDCTRITQRSTTNTRERREWLGGSKEPSSHYALTFDRGTVRVIAILIIIVCHCARLRSTARVDGGARLYRNPASLWVLNTAGLAQVFLMFWIEADTESCSIIRLSRAALREGSRGFPEPGPGSRPGPPDLAHGPLRQRNGPGPVGAAKAPVAEARHPLEEVDCCQAETRRPTDSPEGRLGHRCFGLESCPA
jgi:hypothetical protein